MPKGKPRSTSSEVPLDDNEHFINRYPTYPVQPETPQSCRPRYYPPTVLKELSHQISPILEITFNKSLQTGQVPNDWKEANVALIFKKGDKHNPCNYRPVSLTCIISKCMEHILVSNIMQHLDSNKILYALQHGFRKNFSCDTQLLSIFQDLSSNPSQTDLIILDFSKAFDKVPHRRLQYKLNWYGIRGTTHASIKKNLQGRLQRVVSEGTQSSSHPVLSGVSQGTVLGPILFLIYINDLPDEASCSTIRLFADDCILYRSIKTQHDSTLLQYDLNSIAQWELTWQMKWNIDKCYTMQCKQDVQGTKSSIRIPSTYMLSLRNANAGDFSV